MWPQRFRKVSFSSVYTYTRKQRSQNVPLWRAFSKSSLFIDFFFTGYVWTEAVPVKKKLRFQIKTYTCGRGLSYSKRKIWILIANVFQKAKCFTYSDRLHITPRRHNCLSQAVILSSTSNFFSTIAALCKSMTTSSQKYNWRLRFSPPSFTLTDLSGNAGFLQRVQKVAYAGCNLLIWIHVAYFDYD